MFEFVSTWKLAAQQRNSMTDIVSKHPSEAKFLTREEFLVLDLVFYHYHCHVDNKKEKNIFFEKKHKIKATGQVWSLKLHEKCLIPDSVLEIIPFLDN